MGSVAPPLGADPDSPETVVCLWIDLEGFSQPPLLYSMATSAQQLSQMEYGGGEFLTLSCGILILERRWKLFPVGSQVVVCMGVIWGLNMSQDETEKPQHVIDTEVLSLV